MNRNPSCNFVSTTLADDCTATDKSDVADSVTAIDDDPVSNEFSHEFRPHTRTNVPDLYGRSPHAIECKVQHALTTHPSLKFSRLHVHQCQGGICLEGFLEANEDEIDLSEVVRGIEGVTNVINHVVQVRPSSIAQHQVK